MSTALDALSKQGEPAVRRACATIAAAVARGVPLDQALALVPELNDRALRAPLKAGEASGEVVAVLQRLVRQMDRRQRLRKMVASAAAYPLFVLLLSVGVLALVLTFVVPRIEAVVVDAGGPASLPGLTSVVVGLSNWLLHHAWWLAPGFAAMLLFARWAARNTCFGSFWDSAMWRAPVVGRTVRAGNRAAFCDTLSMLLESRVPVPRALQIAGAVCSNSIMSHYVQNAQESMQQGASLATAITSRGELGEAETSIIQIGDRAGRLEEALEEVAAYEEEVLEEALGRLAVLGEPLMILLVALVIGVLVVAMILPLIQMLQTVASGL